MAKDHEKTNDPNDKSDKSESQEHIIGCTIGSNTTHSEVRRLYEAGIRSFQIMVDFTRQSILRHDPQRVRQSIPDDCSIILHMPFYFHLLLDRTPQRRKMFTEIQKKWGSVEPGVKLIIHCKGIHQAPARTRAVILAQLNYYAKMCPDLILCLENDAGGSSNPAPTIQSLSQVINLMKNPKTGKQDNVGLCVDTQHAYAAGEDLFWINFNNDVDIIHLNAIPHFVKFGGHLDRHSTTALVDSKRGTSFVNKILKSIHPEVPIILERTDINIILKDVRFLKVVTNAKKNVAVDKKINRQDLPERTTGNN